jgi:hypothetical protein
MSVRVCDSAIQHSTRVRKEGVGNDGVGNEERRNDAKEEKKSGQSKKEQLGLKGAGVATTTMRRGSKKKQYEKTTGAKR